MPTPSNAANAHPTGPLQLVREEQVPLDSSRPSYENEGSDRVARGSVTLPSGAWWSSTLEVRITGDQSALLTVGRQGSGRAAKPDEATLVIPPGEADAVLALLAGIIAQARSDGVLQEGRDPETTRKAGKSRRSSPE